MKRILWAIKQGFLHAVWAFKTSKYMQDKQSPPPMECTGFIGWDKKITSFYSLMQQPDSSLMDKVKTECKVCYYPIKGEHYEKCKAAK